MKLDNVKGIGPKMISLLAKAGINEINDLLSYYPFRYQIYNVIDIKDAKENEEITVYAIINSLPKINFIKRNLNKLSFQAIINNRLINVTIFNRAFLKNNLTINKEITIIGKYKEKTNTLIATNILLSTIEQNKIEPIYHLVSGLRNSQLIKFVDDALKYDLDTDDYIPYYLTKEYKFIDKITALKYIHQPKDVTEVKKAKVRLVYEELFTFMFKINYLKSKIKSEIGLQRNVSKEDAINFINMLPFKLTSDQLKAVDDIFEDLISNKRMNRLLLGDVGSGKTIVAVIAIYINYLSGYQSVLMAPTEILAIQHFDSIKQIFKNTNIKISLLTGKVTKKVKKEIIGKLLENKLDLIIGTHAVISEDINFNNLGLVITDEQHRFGVNQRSNLQNKGQKTDVIYLSATPIPRTYALTLYGDMDISTIKQKPSGRKEIKTYLKRDNEIKGVLSLMVEELKNNHQIYVIAPLIEENEELNLNDVNALKTKLDTAFNSKVPIAILHGKIKSNEKEKIMNDFKDNKTKVLISTTVIEVGIDVKNATLMVIFNAERFGLATLHQLRGRVGRNELESKCILISNSTSERLKVMTESNDGFYISERDFELRGEGDLFGVKQSGDMIFKLASLKKDYKILLKAKEDSLEFIQNNRSKNFTNYDNYKKIANQLDFID